MLADHDFGLRTSRRLVVLFLKKVQCAAGGLNIIFLIYIYKIQHDAEPHPHTARRGRRGSVSIVLVSRKCFKKLLPGEQTLGVRVK